MSGEIHANLNAGQDKLNEAPVEHAIDAWNDIMGDLSAIVRSVEELAGRVTRVGSDAYDALTVSQAALADTERASGLLDLATEGSSSDAAAHLMSAHRRMTADAREPYTPGRGCVDEVVQGLEGLRAAAQHIGEAAIKASVAYNAAGQLRPDRNDTNQAIEAYREHIHRTLG